MNQTIPFLPAGMQEVPEDRFDWYVWRQKVLAYRTFIRTQIDSDLEMRDLVLAACEADYAYAMCVFGVLNEPRNTRDFGVADDGSVYEFTRRRGWIPWVPFGFQVEMIRTIRETLETELDETGKDDLFVEKSRDMGATWVFCFYAAMDWLFGEDVLIGMYSYKEQLVDSKAPKSLFFKIRSSLGLNDKVPRLCHSPGSFFHGIPIRMPDWIRPEGFDDQKHNLKLNLIHPTKTNQIMGESTTSTSGIGDRTGWNFLDECGKHEHFGTMYNNQSAVTDHRLAATSPDRRQGDDAYMLAEQARMAAKNPEIEGPRLISLSWDRHPLRDDRWLKRQRARHAADPQEFSREYELDWNAGLGDWVYPLARNIDPTFAPYEPGLGQMYVAIDPAITDETAVLWIQWIPGRDKPYRVVEALVVKTPSSQYLAPILLGFPPGHPERAPYTNLAIEEVLDFTWGLRSNAVPVTYYGDSYGKHKMGSNSDSYYEVLASESERLHKKYLTGSTECEAHEVINVPFHHIAVIVKVDEKSRYHQRRKDDTNKQMKKTEFHNTPRVRYVLEAIKNNRYKPQDKNRLVQNEPQAPAHDWTSHPTTAYEFFSVNSVIYEGFDVGPLDVGLAA